jgi:predicted O-methyltransferase YrrM
MWDLIFIDADKANYINYYELALPCLKNGGVILADNVLFHGEVLEENITGRNAVAINAFNEHVAKDNRVQQVILTVRDGLMMVIKK